MLWTELPPRIYESLKTLCCLANAAGTLQAQEIASASDLPPAQTAKILQMMTWAGFVESRRGTKGGFWLIRPADTIRVSSVISFFAHHAQNKVRRKKDPIWDALTRATVHCQEELGQITVADLAKLTKSKQFKKPAVQKSKRPAKTV
jgi:Rrf2 family protein